MSSAWSITQSAHAPRVAFVNFPLGHTVGRPHESEEQVRIMQDAVAAFETITESGTIVPLNYDWPQPWREKARALDDTRTPRRETPQYQTSADEAAAVERHGNDVACAVCAPDQIPAH